MFLINYKFINVNSLNCINKNNLKIDYNFLNVAFKSVNFYNLLNKKILYIFFFYKLKSYLFLSNVKKRFIIKKKTVNFFLISQTKKSFSRNIFIFISFFKKKSFFINNYFLKLNILKKLKKYYALIEISFKNHIWFNLQINSKSKDYKNNITTGLTHLNSDFLFFDTNSIFRKHYVNIHFKTLFFLCFNINWNLVAKFNFYNKSLSVNKFLSFSSKKINIFYLINYYCFYNDYNYNKSLKWLLSNSYLVNFSNVLGSYNVINKTTLNSFVGGSSKNNYLFNNYYPVMSFNLKTTYSFFKKFRQNHSNSYIYMTNKFIINFLETFFNKNIFIRISNNFFNKIDNPLFKILLSNYKNFQPLYFKNYLVSDFLEIIWYSFYLKDLTILSEWISNFMETLNFKNHKKFIFFFQNFMIKNYNFFSEVLKIKGFFFDIRGKVGVTGSSKKRHICFKFGSLKKSSKKDKIEINQNLVRTYSGVLGLTYIISF